jgi:hypothetical protein
LFPQIVNCGTPHPSMVDGEMGMPAKRELSMRQLRHLLRLHHDGVSARGIGRRMGVARSTIQDNLKRAAAAGLAWPLADDLTDDLLEHRLFGRAGAPTGQRRRVEPDWAALARELKRPGVTMMILREEYREVHPDSYGYSRFCDLLRFERRLTRSISYRVAGAQVPGPQGPRQVCLRGYAGRRRPSSRARLRRLPQCPPLDPCRHLNSCIAQDDVLEGLRALGMTVSFSEIEQRINQVGIVDDRGLRPGAQGLAIAERVTVP